MVIWVEGAGEGKAKAFYSAILPLVGLGFRGLRV